MSISKKSRNWFKIFGAIAILGMMSFLFFIHSSTKYAPATEDEKKIPTTVTSVTYGFEENSAVTEENAEMLTAFCFVRVAANDVTYRYPGVGCDLKPETNVMVLVSDSGSTRIESFYTPTPRNILFGYMIASALVELAAISCFLVLLIKRNHATLKRPRVDMSI